MPAGRPRKFESPEAMQAAVDEYFEIEERPTVTGLALHMGLYRQSLINYGERDEFVDTVKAAKARIQSHIEQLLLYEGNAAGKIFNMKNNFGWKDQHDIEIGGTLDVSGVPQMDASDWEDKHGSG